jgi:hypothetical protein
MGWVASFENWLLDFNDKVHMAIVNVVYDLVQMTFKWVLVHILTKVLDCLCEKKVRSFDVKPSHLHLLKCPLQFVIGDFEGGMLQLWIE